MAAQPWSHGWASTGAWLKQRCTQQGLAGSHQPVLPEPALPGTASTKGQGPPAPTPQVPAQPCRHLCLSARGTQQQHLLWYHRLAIAAPGGLQRERLPEKMPEAAEQKNSRTPAAVGQLPRNVFSFLPLCHLLVGGTSILRPQSLGCCSVHPQGTLGKRVNTSVTAAHHRKHL